MPTIAAQAVVTTGTAIKTLLQVKASATTTFKIKEWGISFDGSAAATPIKCELLETDVAATVTAAVANDITKLDAAALSGVVLVVLTWWLRIPATNDADWLPAGARVATAVVVGDRLVVLSLGRALLLELDHRR